MASALCLRMAAALDDLRLGAASAYWVGRAMLGAQLPRDEAAAHTQEVAVLQLARLVIDQVGVVGSWLAGAS